jgi:hypothetical protein
MTALPGVMRTIPLAIFESKHALHVVLHDVLLDPYALMFGDKAAPLTWVSQLLPH